MRILGNLSIKFRLIALVCLSLATVVGIVGFGLYSLYTISQQSAAVRSVHVPSMVAVTDLRYSLARKRTALIRFGTDLDDGTRLKFMKELQARSEVVEADLANVKKNFDVGNGADNNSAEAVSFRKFLELYNQHEEQAAEILKKNQDNTTESLEAAAELANNASSKTFKAMTEELEALGKSHREETMAAMGIMDELILTAREVWAAAAGLAFILICGIGVLILRSISSGVGEVQSIVTALAELDLRRRGKLHQRDELGTTVEAFNKAADRLKSVVEETQQTAVSVSSAASELSASMESMGTATMQQDGAINSIAAAVEETAVTAEQVNRKAVKAGEDTQEIVVEIEGAVVNVAKLKDSADKIAGVLGIITDISEQTNLLALNAAIEAARAGDAGRGFAVVADEVRKLAGNTHKSVTEIQEVIKDLHASVDSTSIALDKVGTVLQRVRESSESMVTAVEEQTTAVKSVTQSISEFRGSISAITRNVEETKVASASLAQTAGDLQRQVSGFKL